MRGFDDARIRFVNLAQNAGDQSGPNNEGVRRSRGRYLAFLNHDDLWLPDHLESAVRALEETGADLVWPLIVLMRKDGVFVCNDLNPERRYQPHLIVPASFWVLRRELADDIGPWRGHRECYNVPSQDWLYRAALAGKDLRYIPQMTAIALPSGGRPGAYSNLEHLENRALFERIRNESGFREKVLLGVAEHYAIRQSNPPAGEALRHTCRDFIRRRLAPYWGWPVGAQYVSPLRIAIGKKLRRLVAMCGWNPWTIDLFLKYRKRGGFIQYLRRLRGLPEAPVRALPPDSAPEGNK